MATSCQITSGPNITEATGFLFFQIADIITSVGYNYKCLKHKQSLVEENPGHH